MKKSKMFCSLGDLEVEVAYVFTPGDPGRMYMPNGDPGYPPEPAEVEVYEVTADGCDITKYLNDAAFVALEEDIMERLEEENDSWD